jgi:propionyl-CoA carboxylase beta chain
MPISPRSKAAEAAAANGADAQGAMRQPIRPAVTKAAELARDAENRARDRQHVKGKFTARERLDLLLDSGTFEEIGRFRGGDINGASPVPPSSPDSARSGAARWPSTHRTSPCKWWHPGRCRRRKICHLMDRRSTLRVPIIALIDSGGARIQEGVAALTEYGNIFRKTCEASGFVPQLS